MTETNSNDAQHWAGFEALLESEVYEPETHLVLACEGYRLAFQKPVAFQLSTVLAAEIKHSFIEGQTNVITVEEYSLDIVRRLRQFFHMRKYSIAPLPPAAEHEKTLSEEIKILLLHAKMVQIGDYYDVHELRRFANNAFNDTLSSMTTFDFDFAEVIVASYCDIPAHESTIRTLVFNTAMKHWESIGQNQAFVNRLSQAGNFFLDAFHFSQRRLKQSRREAEQNVNTLVERALSQEHKIAQMEQDAIALRGKVNGPAAEVGDPSREGRRRCKIKLRKGQWAEE